MNVATFNHCNKCLSLIGSLTTLNRVFIFKRERSDKINFEFKNRLFHVSASSGVLNNIALSDICLSGKFGRNLVRWIQLSIRWGDKQQQTFSRTGRGGGLSPCAWLGLCPKECGTRCQLDGIPKWPHYWKKKYKLLITLSQSTCWWARHWARLCLLIEMTLGTMRNLGKAVQCWKP